MKKIKIVAGIISLFIVAPIWYYLLYKVLQYCQATELMWFLYWIYIPAAIIAGVLSKIVGEED